LIGDYGPDEWRIRVRSFGVLGCLRGHQPTVLPANQMVAPRSGGTINEISGAV